MVRHSNLSPNPRLKPAHCRYLDEHVRAGYKFLMQNYRAGDKICIFGTWAFLASRKRETATKIIAGLDNSMMIPNQDSLVAPTPRVLWLGCSTR